VNILLTSVTTDQVRAEVRVPGGHRLTAFSEHLDKPSDFFEWCHKWYADKDLDIRSHFTCFPLQSVQLISQTDRAHYISKWGKYVRFYQWHNQPDYLLAYVDYLHHQKNADHKVNQYQIPLLPLLYQEWLGHTHNTLEHEAILYIGGEQMSLALFQGSNLLNQATIQFRSAEDILYYYLFSLDQFSIKPESCASYLLGPRAAENEIVDLFEEQTQLNQDFLGSPGDADRLDLKLLWKCAS